MTAEPVPTSSREIGGQPRAIGSVRISAKLRRGASVLSGLYQQGSAKVLIPRRVGPDLEAVLLNTAGGVTGGDRFSYAGEALPGAYLTLTTQAAERIYRAQPTETGHVATSLAAGENARVDWLPQETILFDAAAMNRRLDVDLAPSATFLAIEPLVFGRAAMGERLTQLRLSDQWRVRRDGRLIFADALRMQGAVAEMLAGPGAFDGAGAAASILYAAPDAATRLASVREVLTGAAGASLVGEVLTARLLAPDSFTLRRQLLPLMSLLRPGPAPKVWMI